MKTITVFTPTYNREHTLQKCFESLVSQDCKDFVWQIIDDGSTDNTAILVKKFIDSAPDLEIQYVHKENGGKVSAINMSVSITNTPLWVCLDSDDYFTSGAIRIILESYKDIVEDSNVCGLFALRSKPDLTPMHEKRIPNDVSRVTQYEVRHKYKIPPEYVQVYKTEIISKYKYPIYPGEKYMPLSYVQDQIDQEYQFAVIQDPLMICEYYSDGITKNHHKLVKNNPNGYIEFRRQQILFAKNLKDKLIACVTYDTGNIIARNKNWQINSPSKFLTLLCYPIALLDYWRRYRKL